MWRRKTILTVGGWQSRTTVEDMDLSLRTYVNGWKAIYLSNTTCVNEVRGCRIPIPAQYHLGNKPLPAPALACTRAAAQSWPTPSKPL